MTDDPAATFEPQRRRLRGLAYRMLGSMAEADDAVQEAYLRWHAVDRAGDAPIGLIEVGSSSGDGDRRRLVDAREDFQL